jgi:hypothetical protein
MYNRQIRKLSRTRLDDVLIDEGVLERTQVEDALAECEMTGRPLSHVLFEREEVDQWDLAKIVARNYSLPFVDVMQYSSPREAEALLDLEFCHTHMLMPFDVFGGIPAVAVCEMPSTTVIDAIETRCGSIPFIYVTLRSRLLEALEARAASGFAPATAADMAGRAIGAPPSRFPSASTSAAAAAPPPSPPRPVDGTHLLAGLPAASMRLGFNMHSRPAPPPGPLPAAVVRKPRPAAQAAPRKPAAAPFVAAGAVEAAAPAPAKSGDGPASPPKPGKTAAWQSIFDLGDEATLDG